MMINYISQFLRDPLSFCKQTLNHYQNNPWDYLVFFTEFLDGFIHAEIIGHPWMMHIFPLSSVL